MVLMPSEYVEECLRAFDLAAPTLSGKRRRGSQRRLCELVASALEGGRPSAVETKTLPSWRLVCLIPALLHSKTVVITVATEELMLKRIKELNYFIEKNQDLAFYLRFHTVRHILPRSKDLDGYVLETSRLSMVDQIAKSEARRAKLAEIIRDDDKAFSSHLNFLEKRRLETIDAKREQQLGRVSEGDVVYVSQALYISHGSFGFRDFPHDSVIIDDGTNLLQLFSRAASAGRKRDKWRRGWGDLDPDIPPTSELRGRVDKTLKESRNLFIPIVGADAYEELDPLSTFGFCHKPNMGTWLVSALDRHHQLFARSVVFQARDRRAQRITQLRDATKRSLACLIQLRRDLRDLRTTIQSRIDDRRSLYATSEKEDQLLRATERSELDDFRRKTLAAVATCRRVLTDAMGGPVCRSLDPFYESPTLGLLRAHRWALDWLSALNRSEMFRRGSQSSKNTDGSGPLRDAVEYAQEFALSLRSQMSEEITQEAEAVYNNAGFSQAASEVRKRRLEMTTAAEGRIRQAVDLDGDELRANLYELLWLEWSLDAQIYEVDRFNGTISRVELIPLSIEHPRELAGVVGVGILRLRLIQVTYWQLSVGSHGSARHFAALGGTNSKPRLHFSSGNRDRFTTMEHWFLRDVRPIILGSEIEPELATRLGVYDRDLPYVVD